MELAEREDPAAPAVKITSRRRRIGTTWLESFALLASPVIAFYLLRLRPMAPRILPDPTMHSTYIFDPSAIIARYAEVFEPTARLREAYRVGFLVPARICYLLFGPVPGFFVLRYLLALVAVVPVYLLLRRSFGRATGLFGVALVLSSPVLLTAWGTDFPDSAVVSYLLGAFSCLVMPAASRRARIGWLTASAALLTVAVWSLATSAILVACALAAYAAVRMARDRGHLWGDAGLLAGTAVVVTVVLGAASRVLIGPADFVIPTIKSLLFLSTPEQVARWHSTSWAWAPYDSYLLVLPAVALAWLVICRRWRTVDGVRMFVGLNLVVQLAVALALQFLYHVQIMEEHYFSSTLWPALTLAFVVVLAELAKPLLNRRATCWIPAAGVVVVVWIYEAAPDLAAFGWVPFGLLLAAVIVLAAVAGAYAMTRRSRVATAGSAVVVLAMVVGTLVLTTAPSPQHPPLEGVVFDPITTYQGALGGTAQDALDKYRIAAQIPNFVGPPEYPGEQLLTCLPPEQSGDAIDAIALYHNVFNMIRCPGLSVPSAGLEFIRERRAAQILMISVTPGTPDTALADLAPLQPRVVRSTVLRSGQVRLHLWLIDLGAYRGVTGAPWIVP
jgi:hypothetical protein